MYKAQELKQLKEEEERKFSKKTVFFDPNITLNNNKDWLKNTKTFYFDRPARQLSPLSQQKIAEVTRYSKGLNKSQRKFFELQSPFVPDSYLQEQKSKAFNENRFMSVAPVIKSKSKTRVAFRAGGSLPPISSPKNENGNQTVIERDDSGRASPQDAQQDSSLEHLYDYVGRSSGNMTTSPKPKPDLKTPTKAGLDLMAALQSKYERSNAL